MSRRLICSLFVFALLSTSAWTLAQEEHVATPAGAEHASAVDTHSHPTISSNSAWAGRMVIIIIAMFVAAAVVGVAVRLNTPEAPPQPHDDHHDDGHDDHGAHGHASDHGHGHGGHGH